MAETNVVPFGKYKGQSIANIAARDPAYLNWLLQQNWFVEQYQHLVINITNFAPASEETPAHNAMQVRFLDEEYRYAFVWAAFPGFDECRVLKPSFELISDVVFVVEYEWLKDEYGDDVRSVTVMVEVKPGMGDDFPAVLRQIKKQQEHVQTLDAVGRLPVSLPCAWMLLLGEYSGSGATFEQVRDMFRASQIYVVMADSIKH